MQELDNLYKEMKDAFDKTMVFGDGNPKSGVLCIGEAPGGEEIKQLTPFVGKAGKNLDKFLGEIGIDRTKCYITNAVKFRPTKVSPSGNTVNATPTWDDVCDFRPYLEKEIKIISPKIIITLGGIPAKSILNNPNIAMSAIHGRVSECPEFNCKVFHLYHPASVIYNASLVEVYKKDLETLREFLNTI